MLPRDQEENAKIKEVLFCQCLRLQTPTTASKSTLFLGRTMMELTAVRWHLFISFMRRLFPATEVALQNVPHLWLSVFPLWSLPLQTKEGKSIGKNCYSSHQQLKWVGPILLLVLTEVFRYSVSIRRCIRRIYREEYIRKAITQPKGEDFYCFMWVFFHFHGDGTMIGFGYQPPVVGWHTANIFNSCF